MDWVQIYCVVLATLEVKRILKKITTVRYFFAAIIFIVLDAIPFLRVWGLI